MTGPKFQQTHEQNPLAERLAGAWFNAEADVLAHIQTMPEMASRIVRVDFPSDSKRCLLPSLFGRWAAFVLHIVSRSGRKHEAAKLGLRTSAAGLSRGERMHQLRLRQGALPRPAA